MKFARSLFLTTLIVGSTSALAVDPKYDEDWSAFGNVLTLVQQMIRIGNHPYPDQAMADLLAGRNHEANQAAASLFAGATADMPPEQRDRMLSIGRELANLAIKPVPGAVNAISAERSLQARKELTGMGLKYYDHGEFLDAVKRNDQLAVELFIAGKGVNLEERAWSGRTALDIARDNGNTELAELISRSLPAKH